MLPHEAGRVSKARYLQNSAVLQTIYAVYDDLGHVKEMRTEKSDGSIISRSNQPAGAADTRYGCYQSRGMNDLLMSQTR